MKREDVTKIFEGATKEQIDQLLDINSADIGAAKKGSTQLQADLDAANAALTQDKNYFSSQNPAAEMGGIAAPAPDSADKLADAGPLFMIWSGSENRSQPVCPCAGAAKGV